MEQAYLPTLDPITMNQYYGYENNSSIFNIWSPNPGWIAIFFTAQMETFPPFNRVKSSRISVFSGFFETLPHFWGSLGHLDSFSVQQPFGIWVQAMWQIDALHDLQPMWIFDPEMMGGIAGDPLIGDGQVLHHSYRSFLTTRCLAAKEESGWIFLKKWIQRKETDSQ